MKTTAHAATLFVLVALLASLSGCAATGVQPAPAPTGHAPGIAGGSDTVPGPKTAAPSTPAAQPVSAKCANRPTLADVYHPYRLKVLQACMTVTGTVAFVRREPDGDWHMNLRVPKAEQRLLDQANYRWEHGDLVLEIVPADQPGCGKVGAPAKVPPTAYRSRSYNYGTCSGLNLTPPAVGTEVAIAGPYVIDEDHGWREIHPVEVIHIIGQ